MSMSTSRIARAVAAKDLRIELRSRVVTNQVLPFSGLVMIMFAFALDNDDVLQRAAGGLVWLATLFSLFILVQRTFAVETYDGALDSLRVAGVNPQGIFLGKSAALFVQLLILESVLFRLHQPTRFQRVQEHHTTPAKTVASTTILAMPCATAIQGQWP